MDNDKIREALHQLNNCAHILGEMAGLEVNKNQSVQSQQTSAQNLSQDELAVVAVQRAGYNRDIVAFKLNNGAILNYDECIQAITDGLIPSLKIGVDREGKPAISGVADGNPDNNLKNLPEF